jgi:hypothetical protein
VIAQVESRAALDCVEQLARVEGIAALYVGPWDLSVSLGLPVPPDTEGRARGALRACAPPRMPSTFQPGALDPRTEAGRARRGRVEARGASSTT